MASSSHPGRVGGEVASRGRGDGSGQSDRDRKNAERDRNFGGKLDAKTKKALKDAFGVSGQASRQLDTTDNTPRSSAVDRGAQIDSNPNDLPMAQSDFTHAPNPTPSYDFTAENLAKLAAGAYPGPGMIGKVVNEVLGDPLDAGFENPRGPASGTGDRLDSKPGQEDGGGGVNVDDEFGQPTVPAEAPKPPAGPVGLPDIWEYPDEADLAASAPQDGLTDEERRRRGNTSIVVLGQGGLAI